MIESPYTPQLLDNLLTSLYNSVKEKEKDYDGDEVSEEYLDLYKQDKEIENTYESNDLKYKMAEASGFNNNSFNNNLVSAFGGEKTKRMCKKKIKPIKTIKRNIKSNKKHNSKRKNKRSNHKKTRRST